MNDLNYTALCGFLSVSLLIASVFICKHPYWKAATMIAGFGSFLIYTALTWGG